MNKTFQAASTLTDRYQTTIPKAVRASLHLNKHDKITYTLEENGKVLISRADEDDPVLGSFLTFLANDSKNHPSHIHTISTALFERASNLTSGVEFDLDAPLNDEDK